MKKNIVACLQGGLGNQCFIYATARALALRAECSLELNTDYLAEDAVYHREYALGSFHCTGELLEPNAKVSRVVRRVCSALLRKRVTRLGNWCCDKRPYSYRPLPLEWQGRLTLDGYWQSERYFYDVRTELVRDFCLRNDSWIAHDDIADLILKTENSVFLHVRSYKEVPGNAACSGVRAMVDYYRKAIAYFAEHIVRPRFFVFSDDIPLARELLTAIFSGYIHDSAPPPVIYVEPTRQEGVSGQIRDFTLMRMCKHGVVADSSFSWWAGWLGEQERLNKQETPIRIHIDRTVLNDDFWPERWVAI